MQRYSILFLLTNFLIWAGCSTETPTTTDDSTAASESSTVQLFEGTMGGTTAIELQLVTKGRNVRGCYFQKNEEITLPVKGVIQENGEVLLSVYDITTEVVSLFMGDFSEKNATFSGKWYNKVPNSNDTLDFELKQRPIRLTDTDLKSLKGTYEYHVEDLVSYLIVEPLNKTTLKIQLMTGYGSCTGEITTQAFFFNKNRMTAFGEEDCFLDFVINGKKIVVTEAVCTYYHGFGCTLEGTYEKVSDELKWILDS
jgi:hypothetical protein